MIVSLVTGRGVPGCRLAQPALRVSQADVFIRNLDKKELKVQKRKMKVKQADQKTMGQKLHCAVTIDWLSGLLESKNVLSLLVRGRHE